MNTPRGITLSGTFVQPVDSRNAAVLFSHSFLADEHSGGHYDELARAYRKAGYATLQFDYSGHGRSDDEVITRESQIEDLQAASGWLADQGFTHQIIHGHSFGSVTALAAHLIHATALFLSAPVLGPLSYDWSAIFSNSQLDELEHTGQTRIPDDSDGPREFFTISKQTLADLSMVDSSIIDPKGAPAFILHDTDDIDLGLVDLTRDAFHRLPDGSRVEMVHDTRFGAGEHPEILLEAALEWAHLWAEPSGEFRQ